MSRAVVAKDLVVTVGRALKMPGMVRVFEALARQAREEHWGYEEYLHEVLRAEETSRRDSAVRQRIRDAHFPETKRLDGFDFTATDAAVVGEARGAGLMSNELFTIDGTLIEAWASLTSFRPKSEKREDRDPPDDPCNPTVDFRGEKRSNETHQSTTDPESRLARKKRARSRSSASRHTR